MSLMVLASLLLLKPLLLL
jgi:hypothetical protein